MTYPIPDAALDDRLGFVGVAGSGKTYSAGTAIEKILHRKDRVIIPDALGVWWGLRLDSFGTHSGFDVVIFGGPHADIPITEHAGAIIGETVAGMKESAIIDLSGLGTKAAERRFMLAFLTSLYRKASGQPVHLIFDEADLWAPQQIRDRDQEPAKLLGMMETIIRRGRVKGFIPWLITQRPAVVNKDVLSQIDGLVAFKLTSSHDRKAIEEWVKASADPDQWKSIYAALPAMQRGEAVVWVPGRGILATAQFPQKVTFDSSRTPSRGEKVEAKALKPLDVGALRQRLSTVEEDAKQNDPAALRRDLAAARAELAKAKKTAPAPAPADPKAIQAANERGYEEGYRVGKGFGSRHASHTQMLRVVSSLIGAAMINGDTDAIQAAYDQMKAIKIEEETPGARPQPKREPPVRIPDPAKPFNRRVAPPQTFGNGHDIGPERKPLTALASAYPGGLTEAQWATIAGMKRTGGTWGTYKSRLRTASYIEQRGSIWYATEPGLASIGGVPPQPTTTEERIAMWKHAVGGGAAKMLDALVAIYPASMSRERLAQETDMTPSGGTFGTYLSRLSSNGLIEKPGGEFRASEALFQ